MITLFNFLNATTYFMCTKINQSIKLNQLSFSGFVLVTILYLIAERGGIVFGTTAIKKKNTKN